MESHLPLGYIKFSMYGQREVPLGKRNKSAFVLFCRIGSTVPSKKISQVCLSELGARRKTQCTIAYWNRWYTEHGKISLFSFPNDSEDFSVSQLTKDNEKTFLKKHVTWLLHQSPSRSRYQDMIRHIRRFLQGRHRRSCDPGLTLTQGEREGDRIEQEEAGWLARWFGQRDKSQPVEEPSVPVERLHSQHSLCSVLGREQPLETGPWSSNDTEVIEGQLVGALSLLCPGHRRPEWGSGLEVQP